MSQAAPPQPAEHTSMELEGSTIDAAALDPAAAAAAAALAVLSADIAPAAADVGQFDACMGPAYLFLPPPLTLCDAPVSCAHCCAGAPLVLPRLVARVDSAGKPACEE